MKARKRIRGDSSAAPRHDRAQTPSRANGRDPLLKLHQEAGNRAVDEYLQAGSTVQREVETKEKAKEGEGHEEGRQTLAGIKVEEKIPVFQSAKKDVGYFTVFGAADLAVSGKLKWGEGGVLGIGFGAEEGEEHTKIESEFASEVAKTYAGDFEASASKDSIAIGFAHGHYSAGFKLNASLTKTLEAKFAVDLPVSKSKFGRFEFEGKLTGSVTLYMAPNLARIAEAVGEKVAERGAAAAAEESVVVTATESGETVVATSAAGAALVGVGVALVAIAAEVGILYEIGHANQEGSKLGIRNSYCQGFAQELSLFTEPMDAAHPVRAYNKGQENTLAWALGLDWRGSLQRAEKLSVDAEDWKDRDTASFRATWAGRAAITQMVMEYIKDNGNDAWELVIAEHLKRYGASRQGREDAYYAILRRDEGDEPPVIPIP